MAVGQSTPSASDSVHISLCLNRWRQRNRIYCKMKYLNYIILTLVAPDLDMNYIPTNLLQSACQSTRNARICLCISQQSYQW